MLMRWWSTKRVADEPIATEVDHWNRCEERAASGPREFWTNHPRVSEHYHRKGLIEGLHWMPWVARHLGRPAARALELGCGAGQVAIDLQRNGYAASVEGIDLDDSRFVRGRQLAREGALDVTFTAQDINSIVLPPNRYELVYSVHSFHHFAALEHIMAQVRRSLAPGGLFVLEEYVGPSVFQWTDLQLQVTEDLLALIPRKYRMYLHGIEKRRQDRDTPERVLAVCPSEALRSSDIVPLFRDNFQVLHHRNLGGTIQHILYAGIVHNFPDDDEEALRAIDAVDRMEGLLIDRGVLASDFALLIGTS